MKKILALMALVVFSSSVMAATTTYTGTSSSRVENYVNSKLAPITAKEQEYNAKKEAQQKANEAKKAEFEKQQQARKAEYEKKQAENKAALEKAKKDAQARQEQRQKAIQAEKDYINSLKRK